MYWDIKQLAQYLQIKPATLYAWAVQGKIPAVKLNGLVRFDREAIERWVESFKKDTPAPSGTGPRGRRHMAVEELIARAQRAVYTARHGETRPKSSLIRKGETDGAL